MLKAQFSSRYAAVLRRMQRLPRLVDQMADTVTKKDAIGVIETIQEGIRKGTFNLTPLKPETVERKRREGYSKPKTPLYGAGDDEANSYINALRIRKIKRGYRVYRSWAKHHKAGLPLRMLVQIHEEGTVIRRGNGVIVIPPRPVFRKGFNRYLRRRRRAENVQRVKDAMTLYIRTGSEAELRQFIRETKRSDFDEA